MDRQKYIVDPRPYKAMDGSYHGTREEVEITDAIYWDKVMKLVAYPDKDLLLTPTQLEQISSHPTVDSLVNVLHQVVKQQLSETAEKSMHR